MSKEIKKNKKRNKGFTLIEILVAVLILAILVAIALPTYNRAVERSRTSDPINTLKTIAKAQQVQKLRTGEYTNQAQNLDIQLTDYPEGDIVTGDTFDNQYFDYTIYGEDGAAARAIHKSKEYELSVDYGTGEIFCRPEDHKICMDLGFEEGRDFVNWPQQEDCDPSIYPFAYSNQRTCVRTLYKDGTKQDRVCIKGVSRCYIYDNEGKQIREISKSTKSVAIDNYDPDTGEKTSSYYYDLDGFVKEYTKYENGQTVEFFGNNSTSLYFYNPDQTLYATSYNSDGTPNMLQYIDRSSGSWNVLSRQYYGDDGKVSRIEYRDNYGVRAAVYYNSDGTINTSTTYCSRNCTGWEPPARSTLKYETAVSNPKYTNYCTEHPEEEILCAS